MSAPRRDRISAEERALIERHLDERGVTRCATGAMATIPDYVWRPSGKKGAGQLVRADGQTGWDQGHGAHLSNRARAARLRRAEGGS